MEGERTDSKFFYEKQKQSSNGIFKKHFEEAIRDLNEMKISNKKYEENRKKSEDLERKKLLDKLEVSAKDAEKTFDEIITKWIAVQKHSDVYHIDKEIMKIKEKCDRLILEKDEVIKKLKSEIGNAELKFDCFQKKNVDDIEILGNRINKSIEFMRTDFIFQFNLIKDTLDTVTQSYLYERHDTWNKTYNAVINEGQNLYNHEVKSTQKYQHKINKFIAQLEDEFRKRKNDISTATQYSQQNLLDIKAAIIFNSEKFDYNFQLLTIRLEEYINVKAHQTRRMNKYQDMVYNIKENMRESKTKFKIQCEKYSDRIKSLKINIKDIDTKAKYFADSNDKLFYQLWSLDQNHCETFLKKIMAIDKILHEQVMGSKWEQPEIDPLEITKMPNFKIIYNHFCSTNKPSAVTTADKLYKKNQSTYRLAPSPEELSSFLKPLQSKPEYISLLKKILIAVSDKSGFLTEKCLKQLISHYADKKRTLVGIETIFDSLGVHRKEDIDLLINFFLPYSFCKTCTKESMLSGTSLDIKQPSNISAFSLHGEKVAISLNEALKYTTHTRDSIEHVVLGVIASTVDLFDLYAESEEIIDIAEVDMRDHDQDQTRVPEKKPLAITKYKMACQYNHSLVISPIYVIYALIDFINTYNKPAEAIPTVGERIQKKRTTISRLLENKNIQEFWSTWRGNFEKQSQFYQLWKALELGLKRYHDILGERKSLSEDVILLRKQNENYKRILKSHERNLILPKICEIHVNTIQRPKCKLPRIT